MAQNLSQAERGAAKWRKIIQSQRQSGQSIEAFCRTHRLGESTFYFWRKALAQRPAPPIPSRPASSTGKATFVPVRVAATAAGSTGRMDIRLPGSLCIRVTPPVDAKTLADVLAVLTNRLGESEGRGC